MSFESGLVSWSGLVLKNVSSMLKYGINRRPTIEEKVRNASLRSGVCLVLS